MHSNTWLDVDPNTVIYEASGNNVTMLRNTNLAQTITDTNIRVSGGIWNLNWLGNPGIQFGSTSYHMIQSSKSSPVTGASGVLGFYGVQYLWLDNITVQDARNFSIQVSQCQDWHTSNTTFIRTQATGSDGIHVNGPSARFDIRGVYGATGDDFVALNAWDWTNSTPNNTEGDITDGTISILRPNTAVWGANKIGVGIGAGVYRINFNDIKGQSTNGGFIWGSFPDLASPGHISGIGNIGQIRVNDAAINVTTASTGTGIGTTDFYGEVAYIASNAQDIVFDGVTIDSTHTPAPTCAWLRVKTGMVVSSITASNFRSSAPTPTSYWFDNFGLISHFALTSGDVQGIPAAYISSTLVKNETGASITNLEAVTGSPSSTLVAFWKMAEGTGTTSADSSLSVNNLTLTGTNWVSQAGLSAGGLQFTGVLTSHADPANFTNINFNWNQPFTTSMWFVLTNPNGTGIDNPRIISRLVAGANGGGYDIGFNWDTGTCGGFCFVWELANTDGSNALAIEGTTR